MPVEHGVEAKQGFEAGETVPLRALLISLGALAVPVLGALFFSEFLGDYRILLWSLALVPAFLLSYYRGWARVTLSLSAGMAVLALAYAAGSVIEVPYQDWPFFLLVVSAYIAIALGGGWLSEVHGALADLKAKEAELHRAYAELRASHEHLKSTRLQLIQAERLDSVGMLAAGVAHEVKNPLMTLLVGVGYLKDFLPRKDDPTRELLDDMWLAVKRADSVIKGLLNYSRAKELYLKEQDINELVERTLLLVKHECNRGRVAIVKELANDLPPTRMDGYKIQQVLVNLFSNSIHAMGEGGTLTIRTRCGRIAGETGDSKTTAESGEPNGEDRIEVEVEDNGPGIPEDQLPKIFDPFFTTKPAGQGTGLGLSVSREIMHMHGGLLDVRNTDVGVRARLILRQDMGDATHGKDSPSDRGRRGDDHANPEALP